jgi:hypothetical protein
MQTRKPPRLGNQGLEIEMVVYFVTSTSRKADAIAIVDRINTVTASNGDSACKNRVQDELDIVASPEIQAIFGLTVESETVEAED